MRYWREKGAIGALIQSHESSVNSLDSMKSWVFMKLLWNPDWELERDTPREKAVLGRVLK